MTLSPQSEPASPAPFVAAVDDRPADLLLGNGASARPPRGSWARSYLLALIVGEAALALLAGFTVLQSRGAGVPDGPLFWTALLLAPTWVCVLSASGAYSRRVLGTGSEEYRQVLRSGLVLLALVGFVSYAADLQLSRALVVFAVPGLVLASLVVRRAARQRLRALRRRGRCTKRVIVVGRGGAVLPLVDQLRSQQFAGLVVVGLCVTASDEDRVRSLVDLPVAGMGDVVQMTRRLGAETVAVTSSSETAAQYLRALSWQLEGTGTELLVAPGLIEVAGPRLHIRPFEGLPLLAVEQPEFEGWRRVVKGLVDRSSAVVALALLSPLLAALAVAVKLSGPGPVLYHQQRVGRNGKPFTMLKFRSMQLDADTRLGDLGAVNESDGPLFKIRDDPRVTQVGRWLRRYSMDELPQLMNVVNGSMSLVGPRPPLPAEVASYDNSVSRRLLVKPGLTGLWQVSGRSDLAWDEAVRLDLRYVENWSLAADLAILWKTGRAVVSRSGAY